jgi:hypothetical protein
MGGWVGLAGSESTPGRRICGAMITWRLNATVPFPYPFTDIQVTTNTAPCDVGKKFTVHWVNAIGKIDNQAYDCQSNAGVTLLSKFTAGAIGTNCDFRIWVHVGDDGSGDSACVDPNPNLVVDQGSNFPNPHEFYQVQQTYIEAPCNAGAAPYPY